MSRFSVETFARALHACAPQRRAWCVALSGGLDSVALLHAMVALRNEHPEWSLRAVHVDHRLQPDSAVWAQHCVALARALTVSCEVCRVQVIDTQEQGIEAAARAARYAAFAGILWPEEVLLTAHHADDQLETLLIALLRGSGVAGLASMPAAAPFAAGLHARPLLGFTRAELQAWAADRGIRYIEDPSNGDTRFDRNFLRHQVIPLLKARWPAAALSAGRAARHLAEADALLGELADADMEQTAEGECLRVSRLCTLEPARRRLVWRRWIQRRGLLPPSTSGLQALDHDMLQAAPDRNPCVRWRGVEVHRHRDLLYATSADQGPRSEIVWDRRLPLSLGARGALRLSELPAATPGIAMTRLPELLMVRFRSGGERLRLPHAPHRSELKKLMQAARILPWWRDRLPLVYAADQLVAVADIWVSDEFAAAAHEERRWIVWDEHPQLFAPTPDLRD